MNTCTLHTKRIRSAMIKEGEKELIKELLFKELLRKIIHKWISFELRRVQGEEDELVPYK